MEDIKRILVVTKSTKHCQKAVHYGISLAKKYEADLIILHVIHNPFGLEGWNIPIPSLPTLETEYRKMFDDAKADLDKMIESEKAKGMPIKELIIEGHPRKSIFEVVEQENIDLIVMLAYQQWRLEHWLFGHGLDEIIRKMPCSVLLVQKKFDE